MRVSPTTDEPSGKKGASPIDRGNFTTGVAMPIDPGTNEPQLAAVVEAIKSYLA
jgi:hypothetical protein